MRTIILLFISAACTALSACPATPSQPPNAPNAAKLSPENLSGVWVNESMGVKLTLDSTGSFSWQQGNILEEGNYSLSGGTLYLSVSPGKTTPYQVLSLTPEQLSIQDPRGAVAYLVRLPEDTAPVEETVPQPPPELPQTGPVPAPKAAVNIQDLYGLWQGPYGIKLTTKQDGTFVWIQPNYKMEGTYSIENDSLNLNVQGNPTLYKILTLTEEKLIIVDPKQNEISLIKKQVKISSVPVPTPSLPDEPETKVPAEDEKSIFTAHIPTGWKISRHSTCTFPCGEPFVLKDPAGRTIFLTMNSFITKAGPGAFDKLIPQLDTLMGPYSKNREKIVDPLESMNGMEAFSRRFKGKTVDGKQVMMARIIGVHYEDYLILGAVVTVTGNKTFKSLSPVMKAIIDQMNFSLNPNTELKNSITGTWLGQSKKTPSFLSLKSKHVFMFYPDGKFIHAMASDKFVPNEKNLKDLIVSPSSENGAYKVVEETIILDYEGTRKGGGEDIEGYAVNFDGNYLFMDSIFLKKVILP